MGEGRKRDFRLMVLGQAVSIFGAALLRFALSLSVLDLTGRADLFAALLAVSGIPRLLMPLGGAVADCFNRRNLMVIYDFSSSFVTMGLLGLMLMGHSSVVLIGIALVLLTFIGSMYTPAVNASVPLLVEEREIEGANGKVQAVQSLADVTAPVLGGLLYQLMGVELLIGISGTAFFLSAVMELFIHIPFVKRQMEQNLWKTVAGDLKEGFAYTVREAFIVKAMIVAAMLNLVLSPIIYVGTPIILRVTIQSTDVMYGIGMGVINLAALTGALTVGHFTKWLKMDTFYLWLLMVALLYLPIAAGVTPFVLNAGFNVSFLLVLLGVALISFLLTLFSIFVISSVQKKTPNENLGKVMAIVIAAAQCTTPVGQMVYGRLFEVFQSRIYIPLLISGVALLAMSAGSYRLLKEAETVT